MVLWEVFHKKHTDVLDSALVVGSEIVVFRYVLYALYIGQLLHGIVRQLVVLLLLHLELVDPIVQNGLLDRVLLLLNRVQSCGQVLLLDNHQHILYDRLDQVLVGAEVVELLLLLQFLLDLRLFVLHVDRLYLLCLVLDCLDGLL